MRLYSSCLIVGRYPLVGRWITPVVVTVPYLVAVVIAFK